MTHSVSPALSNTYIPSAVSWPSLANRSVGAREPDPRSAWTRSIGRHQQFDRLRNDPGVGFEFWNPSDPRNVPGMFVYPDEMSLNILKPITVVYQEAWCLFMEYFDITNIDLMENKEEKQPVHKVSNEEERSQGIEAPPQIEPLIDEMEHGESDMLTADPQSVETDPTS
ncbi:hypothetical protein L3Y34_002195 [Caenorhabditis briggsae]|uniref:Uncharacterized protein n=1 Tax=Caenorhabditis briggsae TaxID=6238 RepID=A0AAE9DEQ7_CAEBR|nr:hypothetical protein L3Y34_002195 [Caenorhabditis briggsae]